MEEYVSRKKAKLLIVSIDVSSGSHTLSFMA